MISKKILTGAEYISLGLSAVGTIVAANTGQIAFATSPLIFSLFLNVVNRQELAKRTHNISHQIASVDNSEKIRQDYRQGFIELRQQIETIQNNFTRLNNINYSNEKDESIALIKEKLNTIDRQFKRIDKTINKSVKRQELERNFTNLYQALAKQFNFVNPEYLEQKINTVSEKTANELYSHLERHIEKINYILQDTRPEYQLVIDRRGSRDILLKTIKKAQERIILVCPWITSYGASDEVIKYCRDFLESGGRIDIGWGHLKDIKQIEHIPISRNQFLEIAKNEGNNWAYGQIEKFIELEQSYQKCNLKLLGTHEKFLVCDRSFAMIGSHNFLTSDCYSSERELGLITKDKNIIEDFIKRFEDAPSLDDKDSLNHKKNPQKSSVRRSDRPILKTQSPHE